MSTIETPNFKEMTIGQLRQYGSHLRIAIAKTATKEEILEQIERKLAGKVIPEFATSASQLKPGYARIKINEDTMFGAENVPVYLNANGYICTIPRGVEVIVPQRVVRILNDAVAHRRHQGESKPGIPINETVRVIHSYPFQILELNPGPEVLTKLEESKKKAMGPRRRYRAMFGHWPKPRELTRAIEQKLIYLEQDEILSATEEKLLGESAST